MKLSKKAAAYPIIAFVAAALSIVVCVGPAWSQSTTGTDAPSSTALSSLGAALKGRNARLLITRTIDESVLVTLGGNTRPEVTPENDRGLVADDFRMEHMFLLLRRPPEQEKALQKFTEDLHNSASPNFHKWLTSKEFGETYGLDYRDLNLIGQWLRSHGFTVNVIYPNATVIDFSGTAAQVRGAFRTEIHNLLVNGAKHIANVSDPRIPEALAPAVIGVVSLNDFRAYPMHRMRSAYTVGSSAQRVVPADLATIYTLTPLFNEGISGQGQTIAVIENSDVYSTSDWTTFRQTFGLSGYSSGSFTQVHPGANCTAPGVNGNDGEAILDAEYASAAAPSAAIQLASCADTQTTFGGFIALENLLSNTPPAIVSISYGACEASLGSTGNAFINSMYQQAVAQGVSVFVSAGDWGAAVCDDGNPYATSGITVNGFASTPYNVAVGGTDFGDTYAGTNSTYWDSTNTAYYGSARSYIPEIPWNDSCASLLIASYVSGSGITYGSSGFCNSSQGTQNFLTIVAGSGGPSATYSKPSWQSIVGNPGDGARDLPDVSLFASNGIWGHYFVYCYSDATHGGAPCGGDPAPGRARAERLFRRPSWLVFKPW